MNFLFVKLSQNYEVCQLRLFNKRRNIFEHTFDGPTPPGYNLACSRMAISCRTCEMYLVIKSSQPGSGHVVTLNQDIRAKTLCILAIAWGLESLV